MIQIVQTIFWSKNVNTLFSSRYFRIAKPGIIPYQTHQSEYIKYMRKDGKILSVSLTGKGQEFNFVMKPLVKSANSTNVFITKLSFSWIRNNVWKLGPNERKRRQCNIQGYSIKIGGCAIKAKRSCDRHIGSVCLRILIQKPMTFTKPNKSFLSVFGLKLLLQPSLTSSVRSAELHHWA